MVDRLEGADAASLSAKVAALAAGGAPLPAAPKPADINARLAALVHSAPVVLFMKGTPADARCGFSRKVVEALRGAGAVDFGHFDVLSDASVREGLKKYSDWPTYPQVRVRLPCCSSRLTVALTCKALFSFTLRASSSAAAISSSRWRPAASLQPPWRQRALRPLCHLQLRLLRHPCLQQRRLVTSRRASSRSLRHSASCYS